MRGCDFLWEARNHPAVFLVKHVRHRGQPGLEPRGDRLVGLRDRVNAVTAARNAVFVPRRAYRELRRALLSSVYFRHPPGKLSVSMLCRALLSVEWLPGRLAGRSRSTAQCSATTSRWASRPRSRAARRANCVDASRLLGVATMERGVSGLATARGGSRQLSSAPLFRRMPRSAVSSRGCWAPTGRPRSTRSQRVSVASSWPAMPARRSRSSTTATCRGSTLGA